MWKSGGEPVENAPCAAHHDKKREKKTGLQAGVNEEGANIGFVYFCVTGQPEDGKYFAALP